MKRQFCFIFCFLFLFSFHVSAKSVDWDPRVIVDGKSYVSEHPFVLKGGDVFISLHGLRDIFGFFQSYNPKLDSDVLSKTGKNILVVRHSREIWFNNSKHFLSKASFFYKSRLYVPLNDIAMFLGYRIEKEASVLTFKKEASQRFMSTSRWSTFSTRHVDKSYLSANRARNSRSLLYKAHRMSIKKRFFVQNGIVYIDATRLLKKLGYRLKHIEQGVSLTYNEFLYTIPFNSREWRGVLKKEKWTFVSESPLVQKNGVLWMPFNSLLTFLDYSIHYNAVTRDIELLDNIHGVEFVKRKGTHAVKVVSRHTLTAYSLFHDKTAHIQSLRIPFSMSFMPKDIDVPRNVVLKGVQIRPLTYTYEQLHGQTQKRGKKHTELRLSFAKSISFFPQKEDRGLHLSLSKTLSDFQIKQTATHYTVVLKGNNVAMPKIYKENKMVILDFPETLNAMASLKRVNKQNFRSIRTSQLSYAPLITRCVLDFNDSIPVFTTEKKENVLTIQFKKIKSQTIAKRKKTRKKRGLYNRIIMLDPGHGGADPGAVSDKYLYEKKYTLDVAKRVKRILEKEGAFVLLTRDSDKTRSLHYRARKANRNRADIFLSLHFNSFSSGKAQGSKTFYYKAKDKKLALHIQKQMERDLSIRNNGVKRSRFFVLRHTRMPATLVEPLFLSNAREKKLLKTPEFRAKLALSIAQGVKNYYKDT